MQLEPFLLNHKGEFNGHKDIELNYMTLDDGIELCKSLEAYTEDEYMFTLELFSDGSFSIFQKDYWKEGEHSLDHKDRLILSVDNRV